MAGRTTERLQGAAPEQGLAQRAVTPEGGGAAPGDSANEPREYRIKAPIFLDGAVRRPGERITLTPSRARSIGIAYLERVQVREEEL